MARRRRRSSYRPYSASRGRASWGARLGVAALVAVGAAFALAFIVKPYWPKPSHPHPFVVVLGDNSEDSLLPGRQRAQSIVMAAADQLSKDQGFLAASRFSFLAQSTMDWVPGNFVTPHADRYDTQGRADYLNAALTDFTKKANGLMTGGYPPGSSGSDVLGALSSAATEMGTEHHLSAREIVIVSNMANDSQGASLKLINGSAGLAKALARLATLKAQKRIPNLKQACVWVVGAGRVGDPHGKGFKPVGDFTENAIYVFWKRYFKLANARLESWGSNLSWPLTCPA